MPTVTVIVPAYNAEPFIEQCAESVLNQTLQDIEVIFIDDGSTDRTGELLDKIADGNVKARVIHQENQGLYKTRQIGFSMATGDYIGWVDADDFIEPDMYEKLYQAAISHDSELVICDYSWFPAKIKTKEKWFRPYQGKVDVTFVERNSQPWNKIVKRECMERTCAAEYFTLCFDEIYIRLLMDAKNPVTIKPELYHYRLQSSSMSSSYTNINHYKRFVTASEELRKLMQTIVTDKYWADYFEYRVIYYRLITMLVAANAGDKGAYLEEKRALRSSEGAYRKNQHFWRILKENFGVLKAFAIGYVIPFCYPLTRFICRLFIR